MLMPTEGLRAPISVIIVCGVYAAKKKKALISASVCPDLSSHVTIPGPVNGFLANSILTYYQMCCCSPVLLAIGHSMKSCAHFGARVKTKSPNNWWDKRRFEK